MMILIQFILAMHLFFTADLGRAKVIIKILGNSRRRISNI